MCPDCGRESERVHSRYLRTLADVAVGGRPVLIGLSVRRLFCDSPNCTRRTFAEQVKGLTARYQRRSPLLQHLVEMASVFSAARFCPTACPGRSGTHGARRARETGGAER